MSDTVFLSIIGVIGLIINAGIGVAAMVYKEYFDRRRATDATAAAEKVRIDAEQSALTFLKAASDVALTAKITAAKVVEVKEALKERNVTTDIKLDNVASTAVNAATKVEEVKQSLDETRIVTDGKLDELKIVGTKTTESLREIHIAVNSTLTAAVEAEAEAKKVAYLAFKRIHELTNNEDDRIVMEAAKDAWKKASEGVKAKADALKIGEEQEEEKKKNN